VDDKIVLLEDPSNFQLKQRLLREMRADLVDRGIHMEPEKLESFERDLMIEYLRNKRLSVSVLERQEIDGGEELSMDRCSV
jgi:hypothetical protein